MNKPGMRKNRILCAGILAATLLFAIFYGGTVPYLLLYTVWSLALSSQVLLLISRLSCGVEYSISRRDVTRGDFVVLETRIRNRSPLFIPYVTINWKRVAGLNYDTRALALSVAGMSREVINTSIEAKCRGVYKTDLCEIRLIDFLGITRVRAPVPKLPDIVVYPCVAALGDLQMTGKFDTENQWGADSINEDISSVSDVREYMDGDSMRRIHWNLSARIASFMSKNYENITKSRLTMLLDFSPVRLEKDIGKRETPQKPKKRVLSSALRADQNDENDEKELVLMIEDKMIESAVSIIYHFLSIAWNVSLCYYENDYHKHNLTDVGMFLPLYEQVAFVAFNSCFGIPELLNSVEIESAGEHMNLCVITHAMSEKLLSRLLTHAHAGSRITLIFVCVSKEKVLGEASWVKTLEETTVNLHFYDLSGQFHRTPGAASDRLKDMGGNEK